MLERSHLAIIKEVDRLGTMTEAAEQLCLTQSALSHAIKKLEQQLEVKVWTKEGRRLRLTQAGQYLLSLANRLLPQLEHAEALIEQIAKGQRGTLRIGMECHPCYRWLLQKVSPFLAEWPDVDVDVKQEFQFGGIRALFSHEIDILITPDPLFRQGLRFTPVFDYELVLATSANHPLARKPYAEPADLSEQTLITYPVSVERLDIFSQFLLPASCYPKRHKEIETTDIMLQMVAAGRGVTALPGWLVDEYKDRLAISSLRLGNKGLHKQIFIGMRNEDTDVGYVRSFVDIAASGTPSY